MGNAFLRLAGLLSLRSEFVRQTFYLAGREGMAFFHEGNAPLDFLAVLALRPLERTGVTIMVDVSPRRTFPAELPACLYVIQ